MVYGLHVHSVATKWVQGGFFGGAAAFPQQTGCRVGKSLPPRKRGARKRAVPTTDQIPVGTARQGLPPGSSLHASGPLPILPAACRIHRHDMNHPEPAGLQRTKQCREHGCGLPLGVVEQHDAAASLFEPAQHEAEFGVRAHQIPVARP